MSIRSVSLVLILIQILTCTSFGEGFDEIIEGMPASVERDMQRQRRQAEYAAELEQLKQQKNRVAEIVKNLRQDALTANKAFIEAEKITDPNKQQAVYSAYIEAYLFLKKYYTLPKAVENYETILEKLKIGNEMVMELVDLEIELSGVNFVPPGRGGPDLENRYRQGVQKIRTQNSKELNSIKNILDTMTTVTLKSQSYYLRMRTDLKESTTIKTELANISKQEIQKSLPEIDALVEKHNLLVQKYYQYDSSLQPSKQFVIYERTGDGQLAENIFDPETKRDKMNRLNSNKDIKKMLDSLEVSISRSQTIIQQRTTRIENLSAFTKMTETRTEP